MIVCADDFGLSPKINKSILEIVSEQTISSVSCLADKYSYSDNFTDLRRYQSNIDIGLHLNLIPLVSTSNRVKPLNFMYQFYNAWLQNEISAHEIEVCINEQFEKFSDLLGKEPDYIDGHFHMQQFLPIQSAIFKRFKIINKCKYIRSTNTSINIVNGYTKNFKSFVKDSLITLVGFNFRNSLQKQEINTNDSLISFPTEKTTEEMVEYFFKVIQVSKKINDLIYIHPGNVDKELLDQDYLTYGRVNQFKALKQIYTDPRFLKVKYKINRYKD